MIGSIAKFGALPKFEAPIASRRHGTDCAYCHQCAAAFGGTSGAAHGQPWEVDYADEDSDRWTGRHLPFFIFLVVSTFHHWFETYPPVQKGALATLASVTSAFQVHRWQIRFYSWMTSKWKMRTRSGVWTFLAKPLSSCCGVPLCFLVQSIEKSWNIFWRKPHKIVQLCVGGHQMNTATGRNLTHDVHVLDVSCCTHDAHLLK